MKTWVFENKRMQHLGCSLVECLPSMQAFLGSIPNHIKEKERKGRVAGKEEKEKMYHVILIKRNLGQFY
jgi:hypothetical protein